MFTPALLTALLHSACPDDAYDYASNRGELATLVKDWAERQGWWNRPDSPRVPIIGRFDNRVYTDFLWVEEDIADVSLPNGHFVWGRARLGRVARFFLWMTQAERKERRVLGVVDLGGPLEVLGAAGPRTAVQDLKTLLGRTQFAPKPNIAVVVVDEGIPGTGRSPSTFGSRVTNVVNQNITASVHAENVLALLADALEQGGVLKQCALVTALVASPLPPVNGLPSFAQANAVDLCNALKVTKSMLGTRFSQMPAVLNISYGNHVGPHNGDSPAETLLEGLSASIGECYAHCAGGNDGAHSVHAEIHLEMNTPELATFSLGQNGCTEFILEFWWKDVVGGIPLALTVTGGGLQAPFFISANSSYAMRSANPSPTASFRRWSGVSLSCYSGLSCLAFGVSTLPPASLDGSIFEITLTSPQDIEVHAWAAVCVDRHAVLDGGTGFRGNIRVPATARGVVCVSGVDEYRVWWPWSSRGPLPDYGSPRTDPPPHVADRVTCTYAGQDRGTSYAAPRVTAATAKWLLQRGSWTGGTLDAKVLVSKLQGKPPGVWNPRIGWGSL